MSTVTIHADSTITIDSTITGYRVAQERGGTVVRRWHNNGHPPPRDLGDVRLPRERYALSVPADRAAFDAALLQAWGAAS